MLDLFCDNMLLRNGPGFILRWLSVTVFQVNECFVFMDLSFMKQRYVAAHYCTWF